MLREAADLKIRDAARDMERLEQMQREARAGGHSYNVVRVVRALTPDGGGGLRHGLEAETAQELAKMRGPGYAHNPHSPLVPWAAIASRTLLQVGTGSLGGYVVGHPAVSVSEALRGWSVGLDGGVQALEGLVSDVHIGAESGSVSAGWIAEPGTGTFSNPTFGTVHLKPRTLAGAVHMSGRLFNQGPLAESLVKSSLQREAGKLFDRAIFNGTGGDRADGHPQHVRSE